MSIPWAYYNEHEPYAADWLRALMRSGHIAPGIVDERDIRDILPEELRGFRQCHFFAGIGVWSYALRRAGWDDERPVWTGSCPCQPFSSAGRGDGFSDERHLWPAFDWLIGQCRPGLVLGEQVASKDALAWFDLVSSDLEGKGYACWAHDLCAAGVGAPHIRQRLFWVADTDIRLGGERCTDVRGRLDRSNAQSGSGPSSSMLGGLADADDTERRSDPARRNISDGPNTRRAQSERDVKGCSAIRGLADSDGGHSGSEREQRSGKQRQQQEDGTAMLGVADSVGIERKDRYSKRKISKKANDVVADRSIERLGHHHQRLEIGSESAEQPRALRLQGSAFGEAEPVRGFWRGADWIWCRDGRYRPVEPGTFPLAHGAPARVGRLRAYGNAINAEAAVQFIGAYIDGFVIKR